MPSLPDPDARQQRWAWTFSGAGLALAVALVVAGIGPGAMPLVATLAGFSLVWPVYRGGRALWYWMLDSYHAEWQGVYYEFDGRQIRVLFEDGGDDRVWICAADVFDVFGLSGRARDPQRVRQVAGREGLVNPPGTRLLCFTERGLSAWMERRTEPVAGKFRHWVDTQLLAPYRKRLEIERLTKATALKE